MAGRRRVDDLLKLRMDRNGERRSGLCCRTVSTLSRMCSRPMRMMSLRRCAV
jgi:hypothetical protein